MDYFWSVVWAVAPTIVVGLIFWYILWAIIRLDRHERKAQARIEAAELARLASQAAVHDQSGAEPQLRG